MRIGYTYLVVRKRRDFDTFKASCPSRLVLELIANKWTVLVINALSAGRARFTALQRRLDGISGKVLTQVLRAMQRDGLVERKMFPVVPPRVEYSLTKLGENLTDHLEGLKTWTERHTPEVLSARRRFDAAKARAERS